MQPIIIIIIIIIIIDIAAVVVVVVQYWSDFQSSGLWTSNSYLLIY
jgi:hypothetical protein